LSEFSKILATNFVVSQFESDELGESGEVFKGVQSAIVEAKEQDGFSVLFKSSGDFRSEAGEVDLIKTDFLNIIFLFFDLLVDSFKDYEESVKEEEER
jgi:hypothetical protein